MLLALVYISETCSNQLSMVKNIYMYIKIILLTLYCPGAELHLEVAQHSFVGIVFGVSVHLTFIYIWTPK